MAVSVPLVVRPFEAADTETVVALWRACGLTRPWNDPYEELSRKCAEDPKGMLVATRGPDLVGTVMAGYDGHRGWINYLGVHPHWQRQGIATALMREAEDYLRQRGAPKINLQVRHGNEAVLAFYARLGYRDDDVVGLGKRVDGDP